MTTSKTEEKLKRSFGKIRAFRAMMQQRKASTLSGCKKLFLRYWQTNSMSGLCQTRIATQDSVASDSELKAKLRTLFWLSIWLSGSIATVLTVAETTSNYLAFSVISRVQVLDHKELEFPAVTICNLNPVSCYWLFKKMIVRDDISISSKYTFLGSRILSFPGHGSAERDHENAL